MKLRTKIILYIIITILIISYLSTAVVATVSDLSSLNGSANSRIGEIFTLSYSSSLVGSNSVYCIQKGKDFHGEVKFVLKNYVEINGKEALVYSSSTQTEPKVVVDDLNAQVAYILNQNQGYGNKDNHTEGQQALWYLTNSWTSKIFGDTTYNWDGNSTQAITNLNKKAEEYAASIGNQKAPTETETQNKELNVTDKTDKDNISKVDVGKYYRIGPFKWEFEGVLQNIIVTGNAGEIENSNLRFIKYSGKNAKKVNVSDILTGEDFYVDVKKSSDVTDIEELELETCSEPEANSNIYTAKIWFFNSADAQNVIYVDGGEFKGEPSYGKNKRPYNIPLRANIGIVKVDDRDTTIPLQNVGFKFRATVYREFEVGSHTEMRDNDGDGVVETAVTVKDYEWRWVERYLAGDLSWNAESEGDGATFYTDSKGSINISGASGETAVGVTAIEVSNPYYGYDIGQEYSVGSVNTTKILENHQKRVKLSGFVWLEQGSGKTTSTNDEHDSGEEGFNGITVYLKDRSGNTVMTTTTAELNLYSEINGGEYQFVDVDLDKVEAGEYHVEFEYCGIDYQSVSPSLNKNNGSKAIDTTTRNILDSKFTSVDGSGTQTLNIQDVTVNYNNTSNYVSTVNNHTGCNVYAKTDEAGFNLYDNFIYTSEEIRYINLGLFEKAQADLALTQDLYNVRIEVNGFSHIYRYATTRYNSDGTLNEDSSWNMGVKFQKNSGTYARAIYNADAEYEAPNHKDNEIRVYVTYKIAMKNESSYLARVNNIIDYCDNRYTIESVGTEIDDKDNITGNLAHSDKTVYNDEYSKYTINTNTVLNPSEAKYIYVQFKMERDAILAVLNNEELLNNVAEINSYTTFKNNNTNTPVAVIDQDSVPGNTVPGKIDTYEDDTDAARSLKLELKNARALVGTVFVDSTGKDSNQVYTNQERLGNGIYDNGETTVGGVKVKLYEIGKEDSSYDGERVEMETTTDNNGKFEFVGYIPGNYTVTYTWGNETYKVQYYKGTIYDESRDQNYRYWYRDDNVDVRKTDALDSKDIRTKIDDEMEAIKINTLESEISKAYGEGSESIKTTTMDSTTPVMSFSVEYLTTITDGTVDQVRFTVRNVDFGIVERAKQQLEFSKRISGFKITLANGQILVDAEITEDGQLKGSHDHTTYMGPSSINGIDVNGMIRTEVDNELIEGAVLETTYIMKVTNIGEADYVSERYYYYGNKSQSDKVRASVTELLDYVDGRLSVLDDKWEEKDSTYLNSVNARQKDNSEYLNSTRTYVTSSLSKDLAPGESNTVDLHTSKLLTSTDDNTFNNQSEIVEVTKKEAFNTGTPVKVVWNEEQFYFNVANSETAIIIPSTGENRANTMPIIIGITTLLVLGVGVFVIKKFIIDNK